MDKNSNSERQNHRPNVILVFGPILFIIIAMLALYFYNRMTTGKTHVSEEKIESTQSTQDPKLLIGLWKEKNKFQPIILEFKDKERCARWTGSSVDEFNCSAYEPYSVQENMLLTKEGYVWSEWKVNQSQLVLKYLEPDATEIVHERVERNEEGASREAAAPAQKLPKSPLPPSSPPKARPAFLESYAPGTKLALFHDGMGISDLFAKTSPVYFDEVLKKIIPIPSPAINDMNFAVPNSSSDMYVKGWDKQFWKATLGFDPILQITHGMDSISNWQLSPDGKYIVFTNFESPDKTGESKIVWYLAKTDDSEQFKLAIPPEYETLFTVDWHPSSKRIIAETFAPRKGLHYWDIDVKTNAIKKFNDYGGGTYPFMAGESMPRPEYSPDGKKVAYIANRGGHVQTIWIAAGDGSWRKEVVTDSDAFTDISWSPDGKMFAVNTNMISPKGFGGIVFFDSDGNFLFDIAEEEANLGDLVWSPDSRYLFLDRDRQYGALPPQLFIIDVMAKTFRTFSVSGLKISPERHIIWGLAAGERLFYYRVSVDDVSRSQIIDPSSPQLWILNPHSGKTQKISDHATIPVFITLP